MPLPPPPNAAEEAPEPAAVHAPDDGDTPSNDDGDDDEAAWDDLLLETSLGELLRHPAFRRAVSWRGGGGLAGHPWAWPAAAGAVAGAWAGATLADQPPLLLMTLAGCGWLLLVAQRLAGRARLRSEASARLVSELAMSPQGRDDLLLALVYPVVLGERLAVAAACVALTGWASPLFAAGVLVALGRATARPLLSGPQLAQYLEPAEGRAVRRIVARAAGTVVFWGVIGGCSSVLWYLGAALSAGGLFALLIFTFLMMMLVGVLGALRHALRLREFRLFLLEQGSIAELFDRFVASDR